MSEEVRQYYLVTFTVYYADQLGSAPSEAERISEIVGFNAKNVPTLAMELEKRFMEADEEVQVVIENIINLETLL